MKTPTGAIATVVVLVLVAGALNGQRGSHFQVGLFETDGTHQPSRAECPTWKSDLLRSRPLPNASQRVPERPANGSSVFGVFSGSTPAGDSIRPLLGIPANAIADLIHWQLALHQDAKTHAPTSYTLLCDYGPAVAGLPGLGKERIRVQREGSWKLGTGTKSNLKAVVYDLEGAVSLFRLDTDILHVLNRDRSLMNGTGGWSYTLYRTEASEKPGDPSLTTDAPRSYTVSPVVIDRSVFGVFDGRSPCHGIARELDIGVDAGCIKVKWRVTLYQDPQTLVPTRYRLEDSLHRQAPREGNWTIIRGTGVDADTTLYELAPTEKEAALLLLKGDDNVLFFLDRNRKPLVGHSEFSYTLNRRQSPSPAARR